MSLQFKWPTACMELEVIVQVEYSSNGSLSSVVAFDSAATHFRSLTLSPRLLGPVQATILRSGLPRGKLSEQTHWFVHVYATQPLNNLIKSKMHVFTFHALVWFRPLSTVMTSTAISSFRLLWLNLILPISPDVSVCTSQKENEKHLNSYPVV